LILHLCLILFFSLGKANQLGPPALDALKKGLQDHLRMLKQTETNTKQPNAVLEHDAAKRRADKLAEILRVFFTFESLYLFF